MRRWLYLALFVALALGSIRLWHVARRQHVPVVSAFAMQLVSGHECDTLGLQTIESTSDSSGKVHQVVCFNPATGAISFPFAVTGNFVGSVSIAGAIAAGSVNGIIDVASQPGSTADVKIATCVTKAEALGGGICNASGLSGTVTGAAQVDVGDNIHCVLLLLPLNFNYLVTINNAASSAFVIHDCSAISAPTIGVGFGSQTPPTISLSSSASIASVIRNDQSITNQNSFYLNGLKITGNSSASVANAAIDISGVNNKSIISNNFVNAFTGKELWIHTSSTTNTGDFTLWNNDFDCQNVAGCIPGQFDGSSASFNLQDINIYRGAFEHSGTGLNQIIINGHGNTGSINGIHFYGVRIEQNATFGGAPAVSIADASGIRFDDPVCGATSTDYCFNLSETGTGLTRNFMVVGGTSGNAAVVNNAINSTTFRTTQIGAYYYPSSTFAGSNPDLMKLGGANFLSNGKVSFDSNVIPVGVASLNLGEFANPWSSLIIGSGANQTARLQGTFTANRTTTFPDGNNSAVLVAALVTTGATSDNVSIQGMTTTGHCSLTATNASAATNIATTFISAKASNQITVTHTATASMNYDVLCSPI